MKKIIFLFILFCPFLTQVTKGQMVVTDPGNYAKITALLETGAEQTEKMNKQVEMLKDAKENIEKVNSYLKRARTVEKAITQSQATLKNLNNVSSNLNTLKNLSPTYFEAVTNSMKDYYTSLNDAISEITSCLTDGKYKMSDAERLKYIDEKLAQIKFINTKINKTYSEAQRLNNRKNVLGG